MPRRQPPAGESPQALAFATAGPASAQSAPSWPAGPSSGQSGQSAAAWRHRPRRCAAPCRAALRRTPCHAPAVWRVMGVPRRRFKMPSWISCGPIASRRSKPSAKLCSVSPGRPKIRSACRCAWLWASSQRRLASVAALSWRREMVLLHLLVETLHAHFQLQHAGRKLRQQRFQALRQVVGDDFKVQKQLLAGWRAGQAAGPEKTAGCAPSCRSSG